MASSYTTSLGLVLPVQGELTGTWGTVINRDLTNYLDSAIAGATTVTGSSNVTLTQTTNSALTSTSSQYAILLCTPTANISVLTPNLSKTYIVVNSSATYSVTIKGVTGPTTGVAVSAGEKALVAWNGSDFVKVASSAISNLTGVVPAANGGTGVANNAANTLTFSGNYPLALTLGASTALTLPASGTLVTLAGSETLTNKTLTSPTLTAPVLGTPASGTLTNVTGLPLTSGVTGTLPVVNGGTGVTTSTGTGSNVLSTSPTLVTPILGTPTSGNLANCTFPTLNQNTTGTAAGLSATLAVASGGTGLTSGTSGGVPYYSATSTIASSAALNVNGVVYGGGAGGAPSSTSAGSTNQVLLGNTSSAPSWGAVSLTAAVSGTLPVANGGTGLTSGTANGIMYFQTTGSITSSSLFTYSSNIITHQASSGFVGKFGSAATLAATGSTSDYCIRSDSKLVLAAGSSGSRYLVIDGSVGSGGIGINDPLTSWGGAPYSPVVTASYAAFHSTAQATSVGANCAYNSSFNWVYTNAPNRAAARYEQNDGVHTWYTSVSGSAGSTISFTSAMTLSSAGNLQVPAMYATTVTTPRNVFIDSSGNMGGISSTRASKTNITPLDTANWIYQLNPVTFNYRKKGKYGQFIDEFELEQQFGLIAEDVETVKPELCIYVEDKLQGIHYDRMIVPLIKALQEQQAIIQSLTERIVQLEAK